MDSIFLQASIRDVQTIGLKNPCITVLEIRDQFIQGNTKLVSVTWYPIIDTAPPDFLLTNPVWSQRFLDEMCIVYS